MKDEHCLLVVSEIQLRLSDIANMFSQPKDFARINSKKQEYLASLGTQGADRRLAVHYRSIGLHVKVFQYVVYICRYVLCVYRVST